jgi:hypothetical protein
MRFARTVTKLGGLPEMQKFECRLCRLSVTSEELLGIMEMASVEAARLALPAGAPGALGEGQKPASAGSEAGGRRGLGTLIARQHDFNVHYHLSALRTCRDRTDAAERLPDFL